MTGTTVTCLLRSFAQRGICVVVATSGNLRVRPASLVTADEWRWIEEHAKAVRTHLEAELLSQCPSCRRPVDAKRRCWHCGQRPCERCGKPSGSVFIATCFACQHAAELLTRVPSQEGQE